MLFFSSLGDKQCQPGRPSRQHWGEIGSPREDEGLQEQREVLGDGQRRLARQTSHQHRVRNLPRKSLFNFLQIEAKFSSLFVKLKKNFFKKNLFLGKFYFLGSAISALSDENLAYFKQIRSNNNWFYFSFFTLNYFNFWKIWVSEGFNKPVEPFQFGGF